MTQWNFGYGDIDLATPINEIKGAGWAAEDNLHVIQNRMKTSIVPPEPKSIKIANGKNNAVPFNSGIGAYFLLPASYVLSLARYSLAHVLGWSIGPADINAAAGYWAPAFWYDNVDNEVWCIAVDASTSPDTCYLASVTHDIGTITNVGSFQADSIGTVLQSGGGFFFRRAAHGSGNFTLRNSSGLVYEISSADGSIVSGPTQLTLGSGVYLSDNVSYQTADGSIVIGNYQRVADGSDWYLPIFRGGGRGTVTFEHGVNMMGCAVGGTAEFLCAIDWDDYVAVVKYCAASSAASLGGHTRFYDKTDFDRWLGDLADMLNLPT